MSAGWRSGWPLPFSEFVGIARGLLCPHGVRTTASACPKWREWVSSTDPSLFESLHCRGNATLRAAECAASSGGIGRLRAFWSGPKHPSGYYLLSLLWLAAEGGSAKCVEFLVTAGATCTESTGVAAASSGDVPTLRFLLGVGCPLTKKALNIAARNGHRDAMRFLVEEARCRGNGSTTECVIKAGHLDCLIYCTVRAGIRSDFVLPAVGSSVSHAQQLCWMVAKSGNVDMLRFLHEERGAELDRKTLVACTKGDNVSCLQYCHEQKGLPLPYNILLMSARNGAFKCLRYCEDHGSKWSRKAKKEASRKGYHR